MNYNNSKQALLPSVPSLSDGVLAKIINITDDVLIKDGLGAVITVPNNHIAYLLHDKNRICESNDRLYFGMVDKIKAKSGHYTVLLVSKRAFNVTYRCTFDFGYDIRIARQCNVSLTFDLTVYVKDAERFLANIMLDNGEIRSDGVIKNTQIAVESVLRASVPQCFSRTDLINKHLPKLFKPFGAIGLHVLSSSVQEFKSSYEEFHQRRIKEYEEREKEFADRVLAIQAQKADKTSDLVIKSIEADAEPAAVDKGMKYIDDVFDDNIKEVERRRSIEENRFREEERMLPIDATVLGYSNNILHSHNGKPALPSGVQRGYHNGRRNNRYRGGHRDDRSRNSKPHKAKREMHSPSFKSGGFADTEVRYNNSGYDN